MTQHQVYVWHDLSGRRPDCSTTCASGVTDTRYRAARCLVRRLFIGFATTTCRHGGELERPLRSLLASFRDIAVVSNELRLHKSGLHCRLKRIAEVTDIDLDDTGKCFFLMLQPRVS